MEELKKRIAADLKDMFVECEHGSVEPNELKEGIYEFMSDCRDDLAAGNLTDREMASLVRMIAREAEKLADALATPDAADANVEPSAAPAAEKPTRGIVAPPAAFAETFPGEVREMVLSEARDAARQSTRERRAAVLDAVLATDRPTGELERRRTELKQTMKDCGFYTDPKAIERLSFKLVSGRTHWKLEYGNVRIPIAKTPSDHRANLNMATDLANRCEKCNM